MRTIDIKAGKAFRSARSFKDKNTEVVASGYDKYFGHVKASLFLHGHEIDKQETKHLGGGRISQQIFIRHCGYVTATTTARLKGAVMYGEVARIKRVMYYVTGKEKIEVKKDEWIQVS